MSISFMLIIVHVSLNSDYESPRHSPTSYVSNSQGSGLPYTRKNAHTGISNEQYSGQPLKVHISTVTHSNLDERTDLVHTYSQPDQL